VKQRTVLLIDQGVGFGGSLVVIARLAEALDQTRYRPIIISAMDRETIRNHVPEGILTYRVKPALDYVRRSKVTNFLRKLPTQFLFKLSVYIYSVLEELINLPSILRTTWIILREGVDIVHINNSFSAVISAKLAGRPVVWHIHGYDPNAKGEPSRFLLQARRIVSISHFCTRQALKHGVPAELVTTLHNPVAPTHRWLSDVERQRLRAACGFSDSDCVVTIIGRVLEWKGQMQFLKAMELVVAQAPYAKAMIVGDDDEGYGKYPEKVRNFANTAFAPGTVYFAGYQTDVDAYYQCSDIVVHASIAPEPFGLVITEAFQNGKPVVGANSGAVPELIDEGIDGFLVDPLDSPVFADRILKLTTDPEFRIRCGENALRKIRERFDPVSFATDVADIYDLVLDETKS
jgi:glycosyltransferase involved in cell wall biosynthesis